jgi:hypothetical protein
MTAPSYWKAFVCRVSFTTAEANTKVRVRGQCIVLATSKIALTSALLIANLDVDGITMSGNTPTFGAGFEVTRGGSIDEVITVATTGSRFIDFLYFDADQNTDDGNVATQVCGSIEYVGTKMGSDFTMDYSHGAGTSPGGKPTTTAWTVLKLKEVTFENGWNIKQDNGNGNYPEPHWKRDATGSPLQPCPYLYSANATGKNFLRIKKAEWTVENATTGFSVSADGSDEINIPATVATVSTVGTDTTASISGVNASTAFGIKTDFFNPFELTWKFSFPNPNQTTLLWEIAGSSKNPIYVCLTTNTTLPSTPYRTSVHLACSNKGAVDASQSVDKTWDIFKTLDVKAWNETTKDFSRLLYYYKPGTKFAENPSISYTELLSNPLGTGRCGAWGRLFYYSCKLNDANIFLILILPSGKISGRSLSGLVIKDWDFLVVKNIYEMTFPLQTPPIDYPDMEPAPTNKIYGDLKSKNTIKGQNSGNVSPSQKIFKDHLIVMHNTKYLDPSYGIEYTCKRDFQDKAVKAFELEYELQAGQVVKEVVEPVDATNVTFSVVSESSGSE